MKKLFVLRHAKASDNFEGDDFDKPLNNRGRNSAPLMAQKIISRGLKSPYILCSKANRTQQTLGIMNQTLQVPNSRIDFQKKLYLASGATLLKQIRKTPNNVDELMVIAHNPGVTELINFLASESILNVPTNGVACILFDVEAWDQINTNGKLGYFIYPKMFNN
jgi:phosphohistidine phosphatase